MADSERDLPDDDASPGLPREQARTTFTVLLEEMVAACPGAVAAIFADPEGEAIDYCTFLEIFDTQLAGAQWSADLAQIADVVRGLGLGNVEAIHVRAHKLDFLIRSIGEGYYLVVVLQHSLGWGHALARVERLADALRCESGL